MMTTVANFGWLAWTLLIGAAVLAVAANVPNPASEAARVVSFLVALTGLIATYYALAQLFDARQVAAGSAHTVWHNPSLGLWAALTGFGLLTLAGAVGARRAA